MSSKKILIFDGCNFEIKKTIFYSNSIFVFETRSISVSFCFNKITCDSITIIFKFANLKNDDELKKLFDLKIEI